MTPPTPGPEAGGLDATMPIDASVADTRVPDLDAGPDVVDAAPWPPKGVIVLGASAEKDAGEPFHFVLTALDPATGAELPKAREKLTVSSIQYDGARDLWYVFEAGGADFFPSPTDPFFLHVRRLDTYSGAWTEVQKLALPPAVAFTHFAVLSNRLVYLAYAVADGSYSTQLVTLDTSNPAAVSVVDMQPALQPISGMLGSPAGALTGGTLTLLGSAPGDGGTFASLTRIRVPNNGPPQIDPNPPNPVAGKRTGSGIGYVSAFVNGTRTSLLVTRPFGPPTVPATLTTYDPVSGAELGSFTFPFLDGALKPAAFSICDQVAFVVGTNTDTKLYAVPVGQMGQGVSSLATGHSGQGVYFEPYTRTILTPFSQGDGYTLTAFALSRSDAGAFVLSSRTSPEWAPPADIRPLIVASRRPDDFRCP